MPSKLSFHINGFDDKVLDLLVSMQPSCVKLLDFPSDTNVDFIRANCRQTLIVYRQTANIEHDLDRGPEEYLALPEVQDAMNKLKGKGIVWEGLNEAAVNTPQEANKMNAWYCGYADLMHARQEKVAAFSFSTGNPNDLNLVPLLADAARKCDYIALHEYFDPDSGGTGYGRFCQFIAKLPPDARKPAIITECGSDDGGGQSHDHGNYGWQHYHSKAAYLESLKSYDQILLQAPYVVGATIYEYGAGGLWESFDLVPMGRLIMNYVASGGGGAFPLPAGVSGSDPNPQPTDLRTAMLAAGDAHQVIRFNTQAALQKSILADGLVPNSAEFPLTFEGTNYVAQRAEHLKTGTVRVYFCIVPQYDNVQFVVRGPIADSPDTLRGVLLARGQKLQAIQFNNQAALQKRIFADSFVPNSAEFSIAIAGANYVAQRAENLKSGAVRVYFCPTPSFTPVKFVQR